MYWSRNSWEPLCHSQVYKMVIWIKYFALYLHCQKGRINWSLGSGCFVLLAQALILLTRLFQKKQNCHLTSGSWAVFSVTNSSSQILSELFFKRVPMAEKLFLDLAGYKLGYGLESLKYRCLLWAIQLLCELWFIFWLFGLGPHKRPFSCSIYLTSCLCFMLPF